jgi:hypothetical protein
MRTKQRTSLPWRRFGYVILISIKYGQLWFDFLQELLMDWEAISNTWKSWLHATLVPEVLWSAEKAPAYLIRQENLWDKGSCTRLRFVLSTPFSRSVFGYRMEHFHVFDLLQTVGEYILFPWALNCILGRSIFKMILDRIFFFWLFLIVRWPQFLSCGYFIWWLRSLICSAP